MLMDGIVEEVKGSASSSHQLAMVRDRELWSVMVFNISRDKDL